MNEKLTFLINQIYSSGPQAVKASKFLVKSIQNYNMQELLSATAQKIASIRTSTEAQEGISAFLEKRKPNWYKKLE